MGEIGLAARRGIARQPRLATLLRAFRPVGGVFVGQRASSQKRVPGRIATFRDYVRYGRGSAASEQDREIDHVGSGRAGDDQVAKRCQERLGIVGGEERRAGTPIPGGALGATSRRPRRRRRPGSCRRCRRLPGSRPPRAPGNRRADPLPPARTLGSCPPRPSRAPSPSSRLRRGGSRAAPAGAPSRRIPGAWPRARGPPRAPRPPGASSGPGSGGPGARLRAAASSERRCCP